MSSHDSERLGLIRSMSDEKIRITRCTSMPPLVRQDHGSDYAHTTALVEVYSIKINQFDDAMERRGELYGEIKVIDNVGVYTLYDQDRGHSEHVRLNRPICLTGPPCSITAITGFAINLNLRLRKDSDGSDSEICKWQFSWSTIKPEVAFIARGKYLSDFVDQPAEFSPQVFQKQEPAGYDRPLTASFGVGDGCFLTMHYAILQHAQEAWVDAEIIDVSLNTASVEYQVRGSLTAMYANRLVGDDSDLEDQCKISLLSTGESEAVKAKRWKPLALSRCIVAVPAYTQLVVEADLRDGSCVIAQGKVEFRPSDYGVGVDYIRGDGDIALRLKVHWYESSHVPTCSVY